MSSLAFPIVCGNSVISKGLSKREYFAGLAMQGLLSSTRRYSHYEIPAVAINAADKLIKELEKDA